MPRTLKRYFLSDRLEKQAVKMPKRAKILFVGRGHNGLMLHCEVEEDADTQAFDTGQHERYFQVVSEGMVAPEVGGYIGSCQALKPLGNVYHVYEVRGR